MEVEAEAFVGEEDLGGLGGQEGRERQGCKEGWPRGEVAHYAHPGRL